MNRDEYERLKEAEKAHLRKVRALKEQLREAQRKQGIHDALRGLDTGALDAEFDDALRTVQEQNLSAEARFDLAMEAVDEAAERERRRLEQERFEAERQKSDAADLVRQMKAQILGDAAGNVEAQQSERPQADPPAKSIGPPPAAPEAPPADKDPSDRRGDARPAKTIGRPRSD